MELRDTRIRALRFLDSISGNLETNAEQKYIEKSIKELIQTANDNYDLLEKQCQELETDENNVNAKIKKKQADLDRIEKRLKNLQAIRPAFMDEYEKLEKELEKQYEVMILHKLKYLSNL